MKRPLLIVAVVFVFGIVVFGDREAGTFFSGRFMPPGLRLEMEENEDGEYAGILTGEVVWCFEREGKTLAVVRTGDMSVGEVRVYIDEPFQENALAPGDRASFEGRFFLFADADDPGQFDTRFYYDCTGCYLGFSAEACRIEEAGKTPKRAVFRLLKACLLMIDEKAEEDDKGLFKAVLTGNQSLLSKETENLFDAAGVLYLLSASGFLITAAGSAVFEALRKRTGRLGLSVALSSVLMGVFAVFTGSTVSMLRAMLIFVIRILAEVFRRRFDLLSAASLTLILLLLDRPGLLYVSSVQYYLAVLAAFGVLAPAVNAWLFRPRKVYSGLIRVLSVQVCLLPVTVLNSFRTSLYAIPTVLVFFGIRALTWGLTAMASLTGLQSLFDFLSAVFFAEKKLFEGLLKLPGAVLIEGCPADWRVAVYTGLVLGTAVAYRLLHLRRKTVPEEKEKRMTVGDHRLAAGVLLSLYVFGLLFLRADAVPGKTAQVDVLYVGQGDGILVRIDERAYLIDCGSTSDEEVGENILLPALYYYGVRKLDAVFLTHDDLDHTGGVRTLLNTGTVPVGKIVVAAPAVEKGGFKWVPEELLVPVSAGFSEGPFTVLWPEEDCIFEGNDASLVLSAVFPGGTALFTGDVTEDAEAFIRLPHAYDFLKVAHHGSRYSSTETFLSDASPKVAAVSYGRRNPYGHPTEEACARIEETGAKLYKTGEDGCVTLVFEPDGRIWAHTFRKR